MSKALFGNRIPASCQYCVHTMRLIPQLNQVLCRKYGVVSTDYSCGKYSYAPLRRIPPHPRPLQRFSAEDFSLDALHTEEAHNEKTHETAQKA